MTYILGKIGTGEVCLGMLNERSMEVDSIIEKKNQEMRARGDKKKYSRVKALNDAVDLRLKEAYLMGYGEPRSTIIAP